MIINLRGFIRQEAAYWRELEGMLKTLQDRPGARMGLKEVRRLNYLYQRASADLVKIATFAAEPDTHRYLESLVARAYAEIHETRKRPHRLSPMGWFMGTLPQTFRRHIVAFYLSVAFMAVGAVFGCLALGLDPEAKEVIMPFGNLLGSPTERVHRAERVEKAVEGNEDRLAGQKLTGAAWYMTHNTRVSIFTMASGATWGIGTAILLFYNGVILGAVSMDYALAGEGRFLVAWLLPHGSVEIPAIIIAGQAGLVLGSTLMGRGARRRLSARLRDISGDLMTLILGVALLLVWAGIVEMFFSQYHEPTLPYWMKIALGSVQLVLLVLYLAFSGRNRADADKGAGQ